MISCDTVEEATSSHWPISICSFLSAIASLLIPILLVRVLSAEEVGFYKVFFLYMALSPVFIGITGLQNGLSYFSGDELRWRQSFRLIGVLIVFIAGLIGATLVTVPSLLEPLFGFEEIYIRLFGIAMMGNAIGGFFEDAVIARGRVWHGAIFQGLFDLVRITGMIAAAVFIGSLLSVLVMYAFSCFLRGLIGFGLAVRSHYLGIAITVVDLKNVTSYSFPVSLAWIFGICVTHLDQLLLSKLISPEEFAVYTLGCLGVPPLLILERSITRILIPELAESVSKGDEIKSSRLLSDAIETLGFFIIPSAVLLVAYAEPLVRILFTNEYIQSAHFLSWFAISYLYLILPYDSFARARGDSQWILRTLILCALISVPICTVSAFTLGADGALFGLLFSGLLLRVFALRYIAKNASLPIARYLPLDRLREYLGIALALLVVVLITQELFTSAEMWFVITAPLYYLMFVTVARKRSQDSEIDAHTVPSSSKEQTTVLMVLQNIDTGGLERMALNLAAGLSEGEKISVEVLTFNQNPAHLEDSLLKAFREKGIPVWLYRKRPGFSFSFLMRLVKHIRRHPSVILHAHELGGLIYCGLAKLHSRGRVPVVYTQHSLIHLTHKSRYRFYEWLFGRFVDYIAVVSEDILQEYHHLIPSHVARSVIPNGVNFPPRERKERDAAMILRQIESKDVARELSHYFDSVWVLYLARFFPKKGQLEALSLWEQLTESDRRKTIFLFVGPIADKTYYTQFLQQKAQCADSERLIVVGSSQEPQSWMGVSDIFLSCSLYEGMPLAPLEALGGGLPTILSDIPGHRLFRGLGETFPVQNMKKSAEILSRTIARAVSEPAQLRDETWKRGQRLRDDFSIVQMVTRYTAVYQKIQVQYFRREVPLIPSAA